ncbi:MAG: SpoIIE family protein phosphatase [Candidatus Latescibacterota bacterium]|nr:MAG: SpoIIE family protein phosphatase [Candidatus Latescibacterota bacterium]
MQKPVLRWKDDQGALHRLELSKPQSVIGRRNDCDIVLGDREVSRQHATIESDGSSWVVVDLGSRHGTFVNGEAVKRQTLRPGDRIRIGHREIVVEDPNAVTADSGHGLGAAAESSRSARRRIPPAAPLAEATTSADTTEIEKLSFLLDLQYEWTQSQSAELMFRKILENALRISGAQRGFILRRDAGGYAYALGLNADLEQLSSLEFTTSSSIVTRVSDSREPVFMTEHIAADFAMQESIVRQNLCAVACLPLVGIGRENHGSEVMGILYLDSKRIMHTLSGLDEKILRKLAAEAGVVLEKLEFVREIEARKELEKELGLAQETQAHLLPRRTPEFPGYVVQAFSRPTRHVGGDFYDFMAGDETLTTILADVSGKGVAAALLGSLLQGALHSQLSSVRDPGIAIDSVNRYLCQRTEEDRFVTLCLASLGVGGEGVFLSAGHIPSYIYRAGTGAIEELPSDAPILGVFEESTYRARPLRLEEGDLLLLLSDGLTEAEDPQGALFGEERLVALLRRIGAAGAEAAKTQIMKELEEYVAGREQTDDITFVLIEKRATPTQRAASSFPP